MYILGLDLQNQGFRPVNPGFFLLNGGFWGQNHTFRGSNPDILSPMQTFRRLEHHFDQVPAAVARMLSQIDVARGRQEAFQLQNPAVLRTLTQVALVQSVEASNAIENITAPHKRIEELVAEKTTPRTRSEEEIAGYRDALNTIHSSAEHIPIKSSVLQQLHRDLYKFSPRQGGRFKPTQNEIEETLPDGTTRVRFVPVGVLETPGAVDELCEAFVAARAQDTYHPLPLIAAFVFDFTCIHPFTDGNGRMSRLLTLLLLYQAGYEVGRFISLERLIDSAKDTCYEALDASTHRRKAGTKESTICSRGRGTSSAY